MQYQQTLALYVLNQAKMASVVRCGVDLFQHGVNKNNVRIIKIASHLS